MAVAELPAIFNRLVNSDGCEPIFPRVIPAGALSDVQSLRDFVSKTPDLDELFLKAGCEKCSRGFNMGTGQCTLTLVVQQLPNDPSNLSEFILRAALGLLYQQPQAEKAFATWRQDLGLEPALLANECLALLARETDLAITNRSWSGTALRLDVMAASALRSASQSLFRFSPSYLQLSGRLADSTGFVHSRDVLQAQMAEHGQVMLKSFWTEMERAEYVVSDELREGVSSLVQEYLAQGTGVTEGFNPKTALRWYIHGPQGIGKSEFVQSLSRALEAVLQRFAWSNMSLRVVKVPLNYYTVSSLKAIAKVRGISDFSIERLVEQSIVRNRLVILHFEECPEAAEEQAELVQVSSEGVLETLFRKYPEHRHRVLTVYTSNGSYAGGDQGALTPNVLELSAPAAAARSAWCRQLIANRVRRISGVEATVTIAADVDEALTCEDLRALKFWSLSSSFHAATAVKSLASHGRSACVELAKDDDSVIMRVTVGEARQEVRMRRLVGGALSPCVDDDSLEGAAMSNILAMLTGSALAPALVVLGGDEANQDARQAELFARLERAVGAQNVRRHELEVRSDDDKVKVIGESGDIRGGVLSFMLDVNGADAPPGLYGVVVAKANKEGQFILREVLEEGTTRTHRLAVHKQRILFALRLDEGVAPTPQVASRAHLQLGM